MKGPAAVAPLSSSSTLAVAQEQAAKFARSLRANLDSVEARAKAAAAAGGPDAKPLTTVVELCLLRLAQVT